MTKTRQNNEVTDHIDLVYVKNDNEYSKPIKSSVVCDETTQDNDVTDLPRVGYTINEIELWSIRSGAICHENQT